MANSGIYRWAGNKNDPNGPPIDTFIEGRGVLRFLNLYVNGQSEGTCTGAVLQILVYGEDTINMALQTFAGGSVYAGAYNGQNRAIYYWNPGVAPWTLGCMARLRIPFESSIIFRLWHRGALDQTMTLWANYEVAMF